MAGLLALPDDVLSSLIAQSLLAKHLPSAIRLSATSKHIRYSCKPLVAEAEKKRRIRWESTTGMVVTNDQRTLTRCGGSWEKTWAVGSLLPTTGKFSWRIRIDRNLANEGVMCIGIATQCGHAFGLSPYSGRLSSLYRPSPGCKIEANSDPPEELQHCSFTAQLHVDSCGSPTNLKGRANGAIVEIIVDADAGTVQFRLTRNCTVPGSSYTIINRSPVVTAISGLPRGVQLRPWCRLFDVPDRVTMSGFWSHA